MEPKGASVLHIVEFCLSLQYIKLTSDTREINNG